MLCIVTALQAEARPLIAQYRLKGLDGHPYRIYTSDDLHLIVSGVGKVSAASAVGYQRALMGGDPVAWLNVGVAGHGSEEVGTALLAHKVVDVATGKTFYPTFVSAPSCATSQLHTVDQPETDYGSACAYDMEASGFCQTAQRFATAELVHCLKIVSDNPQFPLQDLNAVEVEALVESRLDQVDIMRQNLDDLSRQLALLEADPPGLDDILSRWRFTTTQEHQLRRLLQRWQVLAPGQAVVNTELSSLQNRDEVIVYIEQRLRKLHLYLT